jgi:hypothetical protein
MDSEIIVLRIANRQINMRLTRWADGDGTLLAADTVTETPRNEKTRIIGFQGNGRPIGSGIRNVPIARRYPTNPVSTAKE